MTVSVSEELELKVRRHMFSMETEISLTPIGQHCSLSGGGVPDISVQLGTTEGCQYFYTNSVQLTVHSLSCVRLFSTPWTAARQASLSITNSHSLLKLMSIELVMPSSHLILYRPILFPPSISVHENPLMIMSILK